MLYARAASSRFFSSLSTFTVNVLRSHAAGSNTLNYNYKRDVNLLALYRVLPGFPSTDLPQSARVRQEINSALFPPRQLIARLVILAVVGFCIREPRIRRWSFVPSRVVGQNGDGGGLRACVRRPGAAARRRAPPPCAAALRHRLPDIRQSDAIHSPEVCIKTVVRLTVPLGRSISVVCRTVIWWPPRDLRTSSSPVDNGA